ncbi:uncharacterized protein EDB93DRAFT_1258671 [Suillus bovinus]|uniref:uncharacterized protein n=1 Tax=Suillus bovinus TaxID=48563 RepID=UPI001B88395C|nr:uncharacterized protein EDB93DRAFT_1258671 [Suillus bovinus]KAG2124585.1 hypothetical protein EDB93DRAFT_1258671 [Suillus bovinus]
MSKRQDSPPYLRNGHTKVCYGQQGHARFMKSSLSTCIKGASSVHSKTSGWMEVVWRVPTKGFAMTSSFAETFASTFSRATKSGFLSSTHSSHHVHLMDGIAKLFNYLQLKEKTISACCLPELQDVPSNEHFGLIESSFASTFGGLLDVLSDDGDAVDLVLQSTRAEILEEFDIDPRLLSMPEAQAEPLLVHPHATSVSSIGTDAQPQAMRKRKADDDTIVISDSEADELLPHKIMQHMTTTTGGDTPEVTTSLSTQVSPLFLFDDPPSTNDSSYKKYMASYEKLHFTPILPPIDTLFLGNSMGNPRVFRAVPAPIPVWN